jgi:hypothetical protein
LNQLRQIIENNGSELEKAYELMSIRKKENESLNKQVKKSNSIQA